MLDPNTLSLLKMAVEQRQQVTLRYGGLTRHVCPHMLGIAKGGKGAVLHAFQFGGESSKGFIYTPADGAWRFFYLDKLEGGLIVKPGPWYPEADLTKAEPKQAFMAFIERVLALAPREQCQNGCRDLTKNEDWDSSQPACACEGFCLTCHR